MLIATSADGTDVRALDQGQGPAILILHPGLDDGTMWRKVAARLARRFRVVRPHRRQYRVDFTGGPFSIGQEVDDVLAIVKLITAPVVVVGHSSGGVVALEALLASPESFAGAVLYEPPTTTGTSPSWDEPLARARAALAADRPGTAIRVFVRDIAGAPRWVALLSGGYVAVRRKYRPRVPRQIDDAEAIHRLGIRLAAYAQIDVPTVLLSGDHSPSHLGERIDALARVLPRAEKVVLHGQGHDANRRAPDDVARVITQLADKVLH